MAFPFDETSGEEKLATDALGKPYTTLSYANGPGYSGGSPSQPDPDHRP